MAQDQVIQQWPARAVPDGDWPVLIAAMADSGAFVTSASPEAVAEACEGQLCYLATPYTREVVGPDGKWDPVRSCDVEIRTAAWARRFALVGCTAVSPIVNACSMITVDNHRQLDPLDDDFWTGWCRPLLEASAAVVVPPMAGWARSRGVWHEVAWAVRNGRTVFLVSSEGEQ